MDKFQLLTLVVGWILAILIGLVGLLIVLLIWRGKIDLAYLISEDNGQASLSRFQFLLFTFVVAGGLLLLTLHSLHCVTCGTSASPGFPNIPNGILGLIGISGGSYVTAKGIQASKEAQPTQQAAGGQAGGGTAAGG
jgi:hypothetical protein